MYILTKIINIDSDELYHQTYIVGVFYNEKLALVTMQTLHSYENDNIVYELYRLETGIVYEELKPIYSTEGDELPW